MQENESSLEIIDGQQRITTLFMALSAICVLFNELQSEEEHGKTRQYLSGNIGLKSQYMRLTNEKNSNISIIMAQSCEYRENIEATNLLDKALIDKSDDGNKRILNCFEFYYNQLAENYRELEELISVREIILDMKVIHINSENELDCYDIFEILNARGVDLEESELLKNYIFKYAQPEYTVDRAKKYGKN